MTSSFPVLQALTDGGVIELDALGERFCAALRGAQAAPPHWSAESEGATVFAALSDLLLSVAPEQVAPADPEDPTDEPRWRAYQQAQVLSALLFEEYCRVSQVARERWDAWEHRPGGLADKLASLNAAEAVAP